MGGMYKATVPALKVAARMREVRERLAEMAPLVLEKYMENVTLAQAAEEYEVAAKQLQWLLEHMPADADGVRVVDPSVDKKAPVAEKASVGPTIQIGFALGGMPAQAALPAATVEQKVLSGIPDGIPEAEVIDE